MGSCRRFKTCRYVAAGRALFRDRREGGAREARTWRATTRPSSQAWRSSSCPIAGRASATPASFRTRQFSHAAVRRPPAPCAGRPSGAADEDADRGRSAAVGGRCGRALCGRGEGQGMVVAFILVLVVVGSVVFHFLSPWWWTPIASNWHYIDNTIIITFWITGVVFVAVVLFVAYCVFRFRHQAGRTRRHYEPENKKLEWWLTIATALGVAAMLAPGLFVWNQFVTVPARRDRDRSRRPAMAVELTACRARTASSARPTRSDVTAENPLGLNPDDPQRPGRRHRSRAATCICRSASRSRCCCARSTCCTISTCRSSAPRWTWCPAW